MAFDEVFSSLLFFYIIIFWRWVKVSLAVLRRKFGFFFWPLSTGFFSVGFFDLRADWQVRQFS